jgi:hypothetical protein
MPFQPVTIHHSAQQLTNMSAKGATTYQPGPKAQVRTSRTDRGLKARHIADIESPKTGLQPCRTTHQKELGL